jgi:hypothetical protein
MRDFIQNKLRLLFEMVSDRDSDLDIPPIIKYGGPSHGYEAEDIFFMLNVANNLANQMPPETLATTYGNGGYEYMLSQTSSGNFIFRGKPTTKYFEPGDFKLSDSGKVLYMYTMGCSKYSETPCTTIYNPMVDSKIKILVDPSMKQAIMDFVKGGSGYLDDKGEEIRAAKMSSDELEKLANKEDLYTKRSLQSKNYDTDELEIRNKLNDLKLARLKSKDQTEIKKIRGIEGQLTVQLRAIEKEKNKRRSSNI